MFSIMKNICRVLFKRKGFIITTFVLPIIVSNLFLSMSGSSYYPVAVINNDKGAIGQDIIDKLKEIEGIELKEIDESEDYMQKLSFHNYEIVIKLNQDFTDEVINGKDDCVEVYSISQSEYTAIVKNIIVQEVKSISTIAENISDEDKSNVSEIISEYNDNKPDLDYTKKEKKKTINDAFGMILYILAVSAITICQYTLDDEENGTKERIIMSKISEKKYLLAQFLTFFSLATIPVIEYYIICKAQNCDIQIENEIYFILILLLSVFVAVSFGLFVASIIKKKQVYGLATNVAFMPIFMLSGAFWPFEFMSETIQKIGKCIPTRWIMELLQKLQNNEGVASIAPYALGVLLVGICLFLASIFFTKNKIILVKNEK